MWKRARLLNPPEQPPTWPLKVSAFAGALSVSMGAAVLAGWWLGFAWIVQPIPESPGMVPNTALSFVLLGSSLLLQRRQHTLTMWKRLAQALAMIAIVMGVMTLAEFMTGANFGVEHIISGRRLADVGIPATRSGPPNAAAFVLIGLALLTLDVRKPARANLSEGLAIAAALIGLITAAGYAYGATSLYKAATATDVGMAPHTLHVLIVLSAGVICARPERPLIALVTSTRVGGYVVRRLLVGALAIPMLGFLVMVGFQRSLYDEPTAEALLAVAAMAVAVALVLATGRTLDRMDGARTASERAVVEREERLRDLIRQASDGVFIADLDGRFTEINDAMCRMLACSRPDIVGKTIQDFLPENEHQRLERVKTSLLLGSAQVDEWTLQRRDGIHLPVEVSTKILPDGRWQGLVRDISARKQVERATEAVAEAATSSPESSLQAVLETIALEAKLVANAEYAAIGFAGDTDQSFDPWISVGMSPEQKAKLKRAPRPVGLLGFVADLDHSIRVADIGRHPAFRGFPPHHPKMTSFLGVPICRHGRSIGNLYLANKIGAAEFSVADERAVERLAARAGTVIETARLYQAEGLERAWLQAMIDQMPEGVVLTDVTGATRIENRSMQVFSRATGLRDPLDQPVRYELCAVNGQPVAPAEQPQALALVNGITTIGQELALRHPDGRLVPMLVSAAPVFDAEGRRSGAVTIYQDISTLKELERLREEWSSIVAHDLRQPVGVILLEAEAIARMFERGQLEQGPKVIERIRRSTGRLNAMIDDLLDVSRIEARRLQLQRVETDLASLMDDAVGRLSSLAPGHPVEFHAGVRPAPVLVDSLRFEQVLGNLISNAAKYGQASERISIELDASGDEYIITVINSGCAIAPAEIPKLFQRFWRSEGIRGSSAPGLGLGLYISKGLVEAHGGRIWAENISGERTAFHFTIPMLRAPAGVAA
jgi:PAS domain S-box-containing protein